MKKSRFLVYAVLLLAAGVVGADLFDTLFATFSFPSLQVTRLAKAQPDECFVDIGSPSNDYDPLNLSLPCATGAPKVNESYVWGLTKSGNKLWFGSGPNILCAVLGGFLGITNPIHTAAFVCEFGQGPYSPPLPAATGDWRPPSLYCYDLDTAELTRFRAETLDDPRLGLTSGIRSAGAHRDVVFLGGPALSIPPGINLFAFDSLSGSYLGSVNLPEYTNIRKWIVVDDVLYCGVRNAEGGGSVLRWTGSLADPFSFAVVGSLDSEVAELSNYGKDRLAVSTWPAGGATSAGVFISPPIPAGGLTTNEAALWQKVWAATDYDPDAVTARTYGGGALAWHKGWLYWGTMHVPLVATRAHFAVYGLPTNSAALLDKVLNTHRAISIFRGRRFETDRPKVQLLYGEATLPAYNPVTGTFAQVPNGMGLQPRVGASGFGNPFNNYTWTMGVTRKRLFVGTMDWSYLAGPLLGDLAGSFGLNLTPDIQEQIGAAAFLNGADLWRLGGSGRARGETFDGFGNETTYGIRSMVAEKKVMYLGTANPMNLLEGPNGGGWELIQLAK